jgi:hypothetical protein
MSQIKYFKVSSHTHSLPQRVELTALYENFQMDWKEIEEVVSEAAESGDPILSRVRDLRLDINHFSMLLWDPFEQVSRHHDIQHNDTQHNGLVCNTPASYIA